MEELVLSFNIYNFIFTTMKRSLNPSENAEKRQKIEDEQLPVNKKLLDFDLEKICSVSLATTSIYCCLYCGKFFQGRSLNSHAYNHSIENENHIWFINLDTLKVYQLPENIEVDKDHQQPVLNEIRECIDPQYTEQTIKETLHNPEKTISWDLTNQEQYVVGLMGLSVVNNDSKNNFQNVILQVFARLLEIRDWYLINTSRGSNGSVFESTNLKYSDHYNLNLKLGLFLRKYCNSRLLKSHMSPFDLLNYTNKMSKGIFLKSSLDNNDPKFFLNWLLNSLDKGIKGKNNILESKIRGQIQVREISENQPTKTHISKFWQLPLSLPDKRVLLRRDDVTSNAVQEQISLMQLFANKLLKPTIISDTTFRRYKLLKFPNYLIINFDRFNKNFRHNFNDIVVKYDPDFLDLSQFSSTEEKVHYRLITNVVHKSINSVNEENETKAEGVFSSENHAWKIQILNQASGKWYEIDNLQVTEIKKTLMFLSESYIQVYERID